MSDVIVAACHFPTLIGCVDIRHVPRGQHQLVTAAGFSAVLARDVAISLTFPSDTSEFVFFSICF